MRNRTWLGISLSLGVGFLAGRGFYGLAQQGVKPRAQTGGGSALHPIYRVILAKSPSAPGEVEVYLDGEIRRITLGHEISMPPLQCSDYADVGVTQGEGWRG